MEIYIIRDMSEIKARQRKPAGWARQAILHGKAADAVDFIMEGYF